MLSFKRCWQVVIVAAAVYGFSSASSDLEKKVETLQEMILEQKLAMSQQLEANQKQETMIQDQQGMINNLVSEHDTYSCSLKAVSLISFGRPKLICFH